MLKNLKKVISTIAALAISASSMVAFATGYPDVPETATYAQAVKELSALNVISGYEDGTFLPDKNVTRAEITKMIVTSLGSATLSAANAAAGKDTKFADVPGSHWASGFVSTATANANSNNGFINGYDETTFGPDDNVTYAQAIKMLVSALGYQTYAENNGGWPNGYLNYGYTLEIADGVTGVSNDTQVTRAQVAQMIDNAIKAPICVIDGYETQWNGTQTPNFVIKDETSTTKKNSWQCLLNYSHDAYVVNGRVVATQKQGGVKADEVKIDIEKANNYDGYQIVPVWSDAAAGYVAGIQNQVAYIGESNADQYLFSYAEMVLQLNDDDEVTILSVTPVGGESKSVSFASEDYAAEKSDYVTDKVMAVYESSNSTSTKKYELNSTAKMYVNGVKVADSLAAMVAIPTGGTAADTDVAVYIDGNATGTVTLIDSPDAGKASVDGIYDYVMVSYYKDAVVDSVVGDEEYATIYFDITDTAEATMEIDMTDDDKMYSFTLTDGTALTALDLQEKDVLSIAYDPNKGFANSDSYEVLVSRDTVEGKVASADIDTTDAIKSEFSINGETYGLASLNLVDETDLKVSYEYVLYLDAFGKIANMEETATSNKLAIVDNVYTANGDQYYVTLIMPDGTKESYTVKDQATFDTYKGYCFSSGSTKKAIQNRVWSYSISASSGNVTLKENYPATGGANQTYKEASSKIGTVRVNEALTSIVDAAEYASEKTVSAMTMDTLEDDADYTAYGFNKLSDNSYQFVIITEGTTGSLTYKTEFVVYSRSYTTEVDGEDKTAYLVYKSNGTEAVEIVLDTDAVAVSGIKEGTPIVVKRNSLGYATAIYPLFQPAALGDYNTFASAVRSGLKDKDRDETGFLSTVLDVTNLEATMTKSTSSYESDWVFGMVYDKSANSVTIAEDVATMTVNTGDFDSSNNPVTYTTDYATNIDTLKEYDVDADAGIITYSYKERAGKGARVANNILSAVTKMNMKTALVDDNDVVFDWNHASVVGSGATAENATFGRTTFVLAKTIDGDIVEAYFIIPSTTR
jgi:hypothetical protein